MQGCGGSCFVSVYFSLSLSLLFSSFLSRSPDRQEMGRQVNAAALLVFQFRVSICRIKRAIGESERFNPESRARGRGDYRCYEGELRGAARELEQR